MMKFITAAFVLVSLMAAGKGSAFPVDTNNVYWTPIKQVAANGGDQTLYVVCNADADRLLFISCWTDDSTATLVGSQPGPNHLDEAINYGNCEWNNHGSTRGYRRATATCVHQ
jgi:hypothetical protein